jgi:hypothetical protein
MVDDPVHLDLRPLRLATISHQPSTPLTAVSGRSLATAVLAGFRILVFSRHATIHYILEANR